MNVFAKFDEILSMILQDIKETKRYGQTVGRSDGQRENSIPSHKHSLRGYKEVEGLHSPCSSYRAADLRLCFCICKKQVFSRRSLNNKSS